MPSFLKEDMAQGGFLADTDATIMDARFVEYTYPESERTSFGALITYELPDGGTADQFYRIGPVEQWKTKDGVYEFEGVGDPEAKTPSNCNFARWVNGLQQAGVPSEVLRSGSLENFIGLRLHLVSVPLKFVRRDTGETAESTVPVPSRIYEPYPWQKGKKPGARGKSAGVDEDKAAELVLSILNELDGPVGKKDLLSALVKAKPDGWSKEEKNKVVNMVAKDDSFLESREEWVYSDGELTPL